MQNDENQGIVNLQIEKVNMEGGSQCGEGNQSMDKNQRLEDIIRKYGRT